MGNPGQEPVREDLTYRQREALDTFQRLKDDLGYPPSIREFTEAYGCNSSASGYSILARLQELGWDTYTRGQDRNPEKRAAVWGSKTAAASRYRARIEQAENWLTSCYLSLASGEPVGFTELNELRRILDGAK